MSEAWLDTLKNLIFPIFCRQCGYPLLTQENGHFCPECWNLPQRIHAPFCTHCGQPHLQRNGFGAVANFPCTECHLPDLSTYDRIFGAVGYEGAFAEAIKLLKFGDRSHIARLLADAMAEFAEREMNCAQYDSLVPVPLHRVRRRDRGFNQSELLAKQLLPSFPWARLDLSLKRIRPTRTQSTIRNRDARLKNVAGAFAVDAQESFEGETVLLVDDVATSGGTVAESARALKRAGAIQVDVLVAALPIEDMERMDKGKRRAHSRIL